MKHPFVAVMAVLCLVALGGLGCPSSDGPPPVMAVSHSGHNFPLNEDVWTFTVKNNGEEGSRLSFAIKSNAPWVKAAPALWLNLAPGESRNVTVTVDRSAITPKSTQVGTLYVTALNAAQVAEVLIVAQADVAPPTGMLVYPQADAESAGVSLIQTSDGGFALLCADQAYQYEDSGRKLVKTDSHGILQWQRKYDHWDYFYGVSEAAGGGYNLFGEDYAPSMDDWTLLRATTNAGGAIQQHTNPGNLGMSDCYAVLPLSTGGCVYAGLDFDGYYSSDSFILRVAPDGQTEWSQPVSEDSFYARDIAPAPDGGYLLVGNVESDDEMGPTLIRTNAQGVEVWKSSYADVGFDDFASAAYVEGGGIVAGGVIYPQAALLQTDGTGTVLKAHTVGPNKRGAITGVLALSDGGCLAVGWTYTERGDAVGQDKRAVDYGQPDGRALAVKLDAQGEVAWWREYGGPGEDQAIEALETPEGYVVLGTTRTYGPEDSSPFLLFLDEEGNPRVP